MVESNPNNMIRDITRAAEGRKQIDLAEIEMPGLMNCRKEFGGDKQVLKGAKISGSLHMTVQTAILIETLAAMGAEIRWCSCNIYSTQDEAAAAIVEAGTSKVFAWKGMTDQEYWECTLKMLTWPEGEGCDMLVDDGGDATIMIHEGIKAEAEFKKLGTLPNPESTTNKQFKIVLGLLKKQLEEGVVDMWTKMSKKFIGLSEETTTGVHRLEQMAAKGELLFKAINVNDSVTKQKFDNIYGCKHSLPDGLMRATDVMLAGKQVVICGFGDVGKGCASAMKAQGCRVVVTEVDPICALQACMEGYEVKRIENVLATADIYVTATGNKDIIMIEHMAKMKNNAIVGNIGHFDNEIDTEALNEYPGIKIQNIKDQVDRYEFPDGHGIILLAQGRLLNLGCATGHPSFVMSCSFTNQVLAQVELWLHAKDDKYENGKVYVLPKELDEKVAALHLPALGAELSLLKKDQADYIDVEVAGPYKKSTYRY